MELKALLENETIEAIKLSFEESILSKGFLLMCDVDIQPKNENVSYITFTPKDPEKVPTFAEILQFGIILGRDFLIDPDYFVFKKKKNDRLTEIHINNISKRKTGNRNLKN